MPVVFPIPFHIEAAINASMHIWDEPENANTIVYNVDNFNQIHAATINKLVERLTSEKDHGINNSNIFADIIFIL